MKIYGDKDIKRVVKLGEIDYTEWNDKNSAIGFIKEHEMLGEYFSKMYDDVEEDLNIDISSPAVESVEYNGNKYWYGENCFDPMLTLCIQRKVGVYRELPDIYDDNIFHWKLNKKYGSMECVIEENMFEYHCIYKTDGNAIINVKYIACDNLHRNKVTLATIEVDYASNKVLHKAIKQWKKNFRENM